MNYVPLERLIDKTDKSIFKLVILASRRALEIAEGQPSLVSLSPTIKPSTVAMEEIAEGKIKYKIAK